MKNIKLFDFGWKENIISASKTEYKCLLQIKYIFFKDIFFSSKKCFLSEQVTKKIIYFLNNYMKNVLK